MTIVFLAWIACAQPVDAAAIMSQVSANQDRAQEARARWVYQQSVLVRLKRANGKLAREEFREFTVTPQAQGQSRKLDRFSGKYEKDGKIHGYTDPAFELKDLDIDGELAEDLSQDFAGDSNGRDGLDPDLFPLTSRGQKPLEFTLHGRQDYLGRDVYRVMFKPKSGQTFGWTGEALIDAAELQPVLVTTRLNRGIPLAVKTLLGTDVKRLGFKVSYRKAADGVWFPASYGGEFYVRALFLYRRNISISVVNSDFRQTEIVSAIQFEPPR